MIIHNLHLLCALPACHRLKADAPLVVDSHAVLTCHGRPTNFSKRLAGGTRKSWRVTARLSIRSLRKRDLLNIGWKFPFFGSGLAAALAVLLLNGLPKLVTR